MLKDLGNSYQESLLTVQPTRKLLIPLQNFRAEQISFDTGLEIGEVECFEGNVFKPEPEPTVTLSTSYYSSNETKACAHVTTNEVWQSSLKKSAQITRK